MMMHKTRGVDKLGFGDEVETEALNVYFIQFKYYNASRLVPHIIQYKASHDVVQCYLLQPNTYTNYNTTHIVHVNTTCIVHTKREYTINSYIVLAHHGSLVHDIECTHITYAQYCQMYVRVIAVPVNHNRCSYMHLQWKGIPLNHTCPQRKLPGSVDGSTSYSWRLPAVAIPPPVC
jgi:hypothetical protein